MKVDSRAQTGAEFEQRVARIEGLLAEISASADPQLERLTRELLASVLELHQRGLARVLEIAGGDEQVRDALARDARVSALLLLHGLHPIAIEVRVSRAVDGLRERFHDKLEDVTFDVQDGVITVRIVPAAAACGGTRAALKKDFEETLLAAAPDAEALSLVFAEPAPALVTLRLRRETNSERAEGSPR